MRRHTTPFGPVWGASGLQNFFREGYWYHKLLGIFWLWLWPITFVAKTTTLLPRNGNAQLEKDGITPKEWFPRCVVVKFWKGVVLNAWNLSGPGSYELFGKGRWQQRTKPFMLSFMSVEDTLEKRLSEFRKFVSLLQAELPHFQTKNVGLQINVSCPSAKAHNVDLVAEAYAYLDIAEELSIDVFIKICVTTSPKDGRAISNHRKCAGLVISNAIPFDELPPRINKKKLFGSDESPLIKRGFMQKGGFSGKPLLPLLIEWIREARRIGLDGYINAGGGILSPIGVFRVYRAGADSISLGVIYMLRGWNVLPTIFFAKLLFRHGRRSKK